MARRPVSASRTCTWSPRPAASGLPRAFPRIRKGSRRRWSAVASELAGRRAEVERVPERTRALDGDAEGTRSRPGPHPSRLEEPVRQPDAEGTGDVVPSLGPVEAGRAVRALRLWLEQPEGLQLPFPGSGEDEPATVTAHPPAPEQPVHQRHSQLAGEMAVAGAGPPECGPFGVLRGRRRTGTGGKH